VIVGQQRLPRVVPGGGAIHCIIAGVLALCSAAVLAQDRKIDPLRGRIVALAVDAGDQALLKAAPGALYRSGNGGRDWEAISLPAAVARGRIVSVAAAAHRKDVLYVAGPGFGVLRSGDGGRSWVARNTGLPRRDVVTLASHADQPDTIYAYVSRNGIFRSEDAGAHWRLMDTGPREGISQFIHSNMPGSMQTGWFFAATPKGVDRSMDCFCGWRDAGGLARAITAVAYDPQQPKRVYAATVSGLMVSADGGEQWSPLPAPGVSISALAVTSGGELYAAVGAGELFRSADHGKTWERIDA
jgi:photosystem II stability/assembly factor-like uncharacterized protein